MVVITQLDAWFAGRLQRLEQKRTFRPETIAYVVSVLKTMSKPGLHDDLSQTSIVLAYQAAAASGDFASFQRIGDWALWTRSVFSNTIDNVDVVESFGRLSYRQCYLLLGRKWVIYEELADRLPEITTNTQQALINNLV